MLPQILIQKEWVWFGHPFRGRHSYQGKTKTKTKIKSDGPVFLQWLDAVWQVRGWEGVGVRALERNRETVRTGVKYRGKSGGWEVKF